MQCTLQRNEKWMLCFIPRHAFLSLLMVIAFLSHTMVMSEASLKHQKSADGRTDGGVFGNGAPSAVAGQRSWRCGIGSGRPPLH